MFHGRPKWRPIVPVIPSVASQSAVLLHYRGWKSTHNSTPAKTNIAITAAENKIESTSIAPSYCDPAPDTKMRRNPTCFIDPITVAVPNGGAGSCSPS
jgi:hypothetical protein